MSSFLDIVFTAGAVIHLAAFIVFVAFLAFVPWVKGTAKDVEAYGSIVTSSIVVAAVTASVYWLQAEGFGRIAGPGTPFVSEWVGYSFSLYLISNSLCLYYSVTSVGRTSLNWTLFLVGVGGVVGVVYSPNGAAEAAIVTGTSVLYLLFLFRLYQEMQITRQVADVSRAPYYLFLVATLFTYVLFYILSPTVLGAHCVVTENVEHLVYLVGNVLSKILLPIVELVTFQSVLSDKREKVVVTRVTTNGHMNATTVQWTQHLPQALVDSYARKSTNARRRM